MNFKEMLLQAKASRESAIMALLEMYKPLLVKYAIINGRFDEDLYQELCITLLKCIQLFRM
ncbi:helix-turn-helix domain-containing protein [Otoolea muris]|jgi:DNA-directed RNA polymerase specialized sigma24 family protein|uniref:helix-turn-helix domain-containing protein n=1 Tax=Otoolea muris TaxID=2941515 RepID=UPI0020420FEF|nr:helix-turn-helix domain-containing protein [Otoolea muris]